jgi:serine/threonine protein kinase
MPLTPGTRLGPYEIVAPAGAGGMGEVYRGRDIRLDRTVAIKILPSHLSSSPQAKERFEREAKSISAMQRGGDNPRTGRFRGRPITDAVFCARDDAFVRPV